MAVAAAEKIDYEKEFTGITASLGDVFQGYERLPEAETYGRSLSTIHRLGAFMVGKALPEVVRSPEADQARVEFFTSVEEGFGTDMELGGGLKVRDFDERPIVDGRVMAKDLKTAISAMTEAGLRCAGETARHDYKFLPQLTRSKWDHENALAVDAMARGETSYNTRIVISPFPEEAAAQSGNAYWQNIGYVPHLKRGFVQVYHADKVLLSGSLSFDGSNKAHLREVFRRFNKEIPEGEITDNWLSHAITGTFSADEAKALATEIANQAGEQKQEKTTNTVDVTREYKEIMDQVFGSSYVHICESLFRGHQTKETAGLIHQLAHQAAHFNERYAKALYGMRADRQRFTDDDAAVLHELLVYSTIEMMRALHINKLNLATLTPVPSNLQPMLANVRSADPSTFQAMLGGFGAEGAKQGRAYAACGLEIKPGKKDSLLGNLQTAFGGVELGENDLLKPLNAEEDEFGPLKFKCINGHPNERPRHKKITKCCVEDCDEGSVGC